jgi:hypothetical protein
MKIEKGIYLLSVLRIHLVRGGEATFPSCKQDLFWILSRLVYIGSKAHVRERRCPNTANPEGLVRRRYVVGKEDQTINNI